MGRHRVFWYTLDSIENLHIIGWSGSRRFRGLWILNDWDRDILSLTATPVLICAAPSCWEVIVDRNAVQSLYTCHSPNKDVLPSLYFTLSVVYYSLVHRPSKAPFVSKSETWKPGYANKFWTTASSSHQLLKELLPYQRTWRVPWSFNYKSSDKERLTVERLT